MFDNHNGPLSKNISLSLFMVIFGRFRTFSSSRPISIFVPSVCPFGFWYVQREVLEVDVSYQLFDL